jgi:hypothetical protein
VRRGNLPGTGYTCIPGYNDSDLLKGFSGVQSQGFEGLAERDPVNRYTSAIGCNGICWEATACVLDLPQRASRNSAKREYISPITLSSNRNTTGQSILTQQKIPPHSGTNLYHNKFREDQQGSEARLKVKVRNIKVSAAGRINVL